MSNKSDLYNPMFNHNYCGLCHCEPCQCGGWRAQDRIRDEDMRERRVKELERQNAEKAEYHNHELDERYDFEAAHIHELEDTPGIRAPRSQRLPRPR